ncbi:hypothetical protein NQZ68_014164 [Dissostichus eleginoides]|nr:hypothetical protein NQZ68_014164 [Dissostichus eleginoides]
MHMPQRAGLPVAVALLTSLLQEQFMGCSVTRNSDPWACGTAPISITKSCHESGRARAY